MISSEHAENARSKLAEFCVFEPKAVSEQRSVAKCQLAKKVILVWVCKDMSVPRSSETGLVSPAARRRFHCGGEIGQSCRPYSVVSAPLRSVCYTAVKGFPNAALPRWLI